MLRQALAEAERGEIISAALISVTPTMAPITRWFVNGNIDGHLLITGLSRLTHRLHSLAEANAVLEPDRGA